MCENGPEKVEKKYTVAHSIPDVTPRKKKKFDTSGVLYAGSSGTLKKINKAKDHGKLIQLALKSHISFLLY